MNSVYSTPNPRGRRSLPPKEIKSNHPCFPIPGNTEPPDIPRESINNYGFTPCFTDCKPQITKVLTQITDFITQFTETWNIKIFFSYKTLIFARRREKL